MASSPLKVGTKIECGLEADLAGRAELHFEPDGLCCIIVASLEVVQGREANLA
ncbi:MAG: hypothetical protein M3N39_02445 [Pseudomonadota bacterium]|nr:hypothetical protein [Pseudomonadota bacterium]